MRKSSLLLATLLTAGCHTLINLGNQQQKVEEALARDDFATAAAIIEHTGSDHPQYAALQEQYPDIRQASQAYRTRAEHDALALSRDKQWQQAFDLIDSTIAQVVDPTSLQALRESLQAKQAAQLNQLLAERRLAQARALLLQPTLDKTLAQYSDPAARREVTQLEQERKQLIADLNHLGEYYADRQHWQQTRELLDTAHRLAPGEPTPELLSRARSILNNEQQQAKARQNNALQAKAESLMATYQDSGQLKDLLAARAFLNSHRGNDALVQQRARTEQWCRRRFDEEMNTGEALYARGQYREAYRIWKQVQPLYPDNVELNKKLERSQRVLNNLRTLKDS
ncbi:hypothetical protein A11A3_08510 [Alcanivorax hongdengensis A-11-3]|uniref:Lipoprotein n=1 Tax=Alcanivorax hongdengensis A-11-3 TaxID=1177179 RepID=L0WBT8_9GAMM|nr:hypothetical protein [Alcanivorax hongdengensis]EKF74449.1 hypothetical protein A11A3_08510 [Alcanivorax hongdengensis A-11-3]